jgi:hypothetical protein
MAEAVRRAATVVVADDVVHDKRATFTELEFAQGFAQLANTQGWARRPKWGCPGK